MPYSSLLLDDAVVLGHQGEDVGLETLTDVPADAADDALLEAILLKLVLPSTSKENDTPVIVYSGAQQKTKQQPLPAVELCICVARPRRLTRFGA